MGSGALAAALKKGRSDDEDVRVRADDCCSSGAQASRPLGETPEFTRKERRISMRELVRCRTRAGVISAIRPF
jgi:hypothetical protein